VVDGRWARVGSTNLNLVSWLGNWELDVCVEDAGFAREMEDAFLDDLESATEIVLHGHRRPVPEERRPPRARRRRIAAGSASRAAAAALELGSVVRAAVAQRSLAYVESRSLALAGSLLLLVAGAALLWPRLLALPFGIAVGWLAVSLLVRAIRSAGARGGARSARRTGGGGAPEGGP
jgi:cardiolipin synthase